MSQRPPPIDTEALAAWILNGLRETLEYRMRETLSPAGWMSRVRSWVPSKSEVLHRALQPAFKKEGFEFEELRFGDSPYQLIKKRIRPGDRRLLVVPGFGDTPASWLPIYLLSKTVIHHQFDEIVVIDFPGYLGFLSQHRLTPSMAMLLGVIKTVGEAYPPHTLMGHSLGGWLCGKFAQSGSSRTVPHLILIAPAGLTPENERQAFGDFILEGQHISIEELLGRVVYDPRPYQVLLKEEFKSFNSQDEIRVFIESVKAEQFISPELPIGCDQLSIVWGDSDIFVPTQWSRHWVEKYGPITDLYLLRRTGHLPQLERPKELSEILKTAFLSSSQTEGRLWTKLHRRSKKALTESGAVQKLLETRL